MEEENTTQELHIARVALGVMGNLSCAPTATYFHFARRIMYLAHKMCIRPMAGYRT